ncbi:sensor domain-containing diguanylate cyclase [Clostridium psychrophilum]|uniref:sensor domain-containing diguanylate cyclase n=1 Tax=Clostridium psychrophilum TaxID=132926 RepID=UPI001C0AFA2B|nr:diguanylate cyclase [Clostridium psychrophilum]MBU3183040.1 diguanylate cyclase [Clostridium psychrophilum]
METCTNKYSHISREIIIETDSLGIIRFITPNCSILGYDQSEFLNTDINTYIECNFNTITVNKSFKCKFLNKNGDKIHFDIFVISKMNSKKQSIYFILYLLPINKHAYLNEGDLKFNKLFENTNDIIFKMQIIPEIKFTYLNSAVENIFGYDLKNYFQNPMLPFETVHPDDRDIQLSKVNKKTDFSNLFYVRFKHKNGYYVLIEDYIIPTFNDKDELIFVEGICRDITKRIQLEKKLEKLSYIDGLTGLYNRTYLNKQIKILKEDVDKPIAIIVCDLDNLKYFNDNFGHCRGDIMLKSVGYFLINNFVEDSIVIRNGGDEFIIILSSFSEKKAEEIYSDMLVSIANYNDNHKIPITLSSRFSYSCSSKTILKLLSTADKRMYEKRYKRESIKLSPAEL